MLQAILDYQNASPFVLPYAPGTPTQRRIEAEEAARQFDISQDLAEREFAYKQQQNAIANALAWARLNAQTIPKVNELEEALYSVDFAIENNPSKTLSEIINSINAQSRNLIAHGVDPEQVKQYAMEKYYNYHYNRAVDAVRSGTTWDYGKDIADMPWLTDKYNPFKYLEQQGPTKQDVITMEEAQKFAADSTRSDSKQRFTAEQIINLANKGLLEWVLKEIYGDPLKALGGE